MPVHISVGHLFWLGAVAFAVPTSVRCTQADEQAQTPPVVAQREQVEVCKPEASVKAGQEVIARLKHGDRLPVLRREGPWVGVEIRTADGLRRGWVLASSVRPVIDPGITERSTAPAAPRLAHITVDYLQFPSGHGGNAMQMMICFRVTIANLCDAAIALDVEKSELRVGDTVLKPAAVSGVPPAASITTIAIPNANGFQDFKQLSELPVLKSQELLAGGNAVGWLAFELPQSVTGSLFGAGGPLSEPWLLSIPVGAEALQMDLRKEELAQGPHQRSCTIDASIPVIEIGSRLNGLNVDALTVPLQTLLKEQTGFIVLFTEKQLFVDQIAQARIMNSRPQKPWRDVPAYWVYPHELFGTVHGVFVGGGTFRGMSREADAVMYILRERSDPEKVFIEQLKNESAEVRSAAVAQLREHVEKPGVIDALVAVISQKDDPVRAGAIHTLNGYFQGTSTSNRALWPPSAPAPTRVLEGNLLELMLSAAGDSEATVRAAAMYVLANSQDSRATRAIVSGLKDADLAVCAAAAAAAGTQPAEAVAEMLMTSVDNDQIGAAVCRSLGQLKYEAAIPRLKEVVAQKRGISAESAIAALHDMGALSDVEAALAKLERAGYLQPHERAALVKAQDEHIVARLKEMLSQDQSSWTAALTLADMGESAAYDRLMAWAMDREHLRSPDVYVALGKLGDKRAIEPLQKMLEASYGQKRAAIVEALLLLDAPHIFEQTTQQITGGGIPPRGEVNSLLAVLGRAAGNRAIPVLEQHLDSEELCRVAASGLWDVGTPEAIIALQKRLSAENYAQTEEVLKVLMTRAAYQAHVGGEEVRQKMVRQMRQLLCGLQTSGNPATRKAAGERLKLLPAE